MESHFGLPSADPPKREMVFFPQLTTTPPSKSDAFRRVLWTGLYSQLAIHTIPAEGQLGDEVRISSNWCLGHEFTFYSVCRPSPSIK